MDWALDEAYDIVYRLPSPSLLRIDYECYGRYPAMSSLSISRVRGFDRWQTKTNFRITVVLPEHNGVVFPALNLGFLIHYRSRDDNFTLRQLHAKVGI
jgi:hypothetical protein